MITTKADLINHIGKTHNFSSYLEISTTATGYAYKAVDPTIFTTKEIILYAVLEGESLRHDLSITPMDYDEAVDQLADRKFDVVFVDPWHTFEHSKRDIETALRFVADDGFVVIHDCNPMDEAMVGPYHYGDWCGQTYEAFIAFKLAHPTIESYVVDIDFGCGVIRKSGAMRGFRLDDGMGLGDVVEWGYFDEHREQLLGLVSVDKLRRGAPDASASDASAS